MHAQQLSYHDMTLDPSGKIMTKETKAKLRKQYGYCLTCPGVPVLLYDIQKSRMNPLWSSKKARTIEGVCFDGRCVQCNSKMRSQGSTSGSTMSLVCLSTHEGMSTQSYHLQRSNSVESSSFGLVSNSSQRNTDNVDYYRNWSRGNPSSSDDGFDGSVSSQSMSSSVANSVTAPIPSNVAFGAVRPLARDFPYQRAGSFENDFDVSLHEESREIERFTPAMTRTNECSRAPPIRSKSQDAILASSNGSRGNVNTSRSLHGSDEPYAMPSRRGGRRVTGLAPLPPRTAVCNEINEISRSSMSIVDERDLQREDSFTVCLDKTPGAEEIVKKNRNNEEAAVEELRVLVQALKGEENLGILTEILISSMEVHKSLESVQAFVLEVMSEAFRNTLTSSEVLVAKILHAMKDFGPSLAVQKAGCKVIQALATNESNGAILVRNGACNALSAALFRHIGDTDLVVVAVATLRMLSVSRDARVLLQQNDVANQVAQAMQCNPFFVPLQIDGCALLSNIAVNEETRTVNAVGDEAVEAVIGALKVHKGDPAVTASACFALKNFAYEDLNLKSLVKVCDVFDILHGATSSGGGDDALFVLEKLQLTMVETESLDEQTLALLPDIDSVVDLVNLMKTNCRSPKVILEGMKVIIDLLKRKSVHHCEALEDGEVLANLLQFPELYHDDVQIQQQARALMDILFGEEENAMNTASHTIPTQEPLCVNADSQE